MRRAWLEHKVRSLLVQHDLGRERERDMLTVMQLGEVVQVSEGKAICREGDPAESAYVLLEGSVQVVVSDSEDREREVAVLQAPAIFGHVGMLDGVRHCATHLAGTACVVIELDSGMCERFVVAPTSQGAAFRHLLVASMAQQFAARNDRFGLVRTRINTLAERASRSGSTRPRRSRWSLRGSSRVEDESASDVLDMARSTNGWDLDLDGVDRVRSVEDEAMKRSRLGKKR